MLFTVISGAPTDNCWTLSNKSFRPKTFWGQTQRYYVLAPFYRPVQHEYCNVVIKTHSGEFIMSADLDHIIRFRGRWFVVPSQVYVTKSNCKLSGVKTEKSNIYFLKTRNLTTDRSIYLRHLPVVSCAMCSRENISRPNQ